jgi:hypothetical protein
MEPPKQLFTVAIAGHGTADTEGYLARTEWGTLYITDHWLYALRVESVTEELQAEMKREIGDHGWRLTAG